MQSIRIAFRNVMRQRKRTSLLGGAVAIGFFVFTVVHGFTSGLLETVEDNVAAITGGHIYVGGTEVSDLGSAVSVIRDPAALDAALAALGDGIVSIHARSSTQATVIFGSREATQLVVGVDPAQETRFLDGLTFAAGEPETFLARDAGLLLPSGTLHALGVEVGEHVIVKAATIHGQLNIGDFVVTGSITGQETFGFDFGYARIGALNALLDLGPGQDQALSIRLEDLSNLDATTDALYDALAPLAPTVRRSEEPTQMPMREVLLGGGLPRVEGGERWEGTRLEITTIDDLLGGLNDLVAVMNTVSLVVFLIIMLIILAGVTNAYRMVMIERTVEIGTMRAMGVQRSGIRNIFVWEAFFIAAGGAVVGLALAVATMGTIGLIDLGASDFGFFLHRGHLRFSVTALRTIVTALLICAMSVGSVLIPAQAAARLDPAVALRGRF